MNKEWSELNKLMQKQLNRKDSFEEGIKTLLNLRKSLMETMDQFQSLSKEQLCVIPFINADGYHSKTIVYSLFHIFRIEDIVVHTLIKQDEEVFMKDNYQKLLNSPIITTGNELVKMGIAEFSKHINIKELFHYIHAVDEATTKMLLKLSYDDLKTKYAEKDKENIRKLKVVNEESAGWLIDYWCGKDLKGLIQMPLSRHWIMHVEAALRIKNKVV